MKKYFLVLLCLLCNVFHTYAFQEKVHMVWSRSMDKNIPVNIITPGNYNESKLYTVIYLLHGFGDNHLRWSQGGVVGSLADQYNLIVVMPDGGRDSWYFDSPVVEKYQYETFISDELISYVDSCFSTIKDRNARAITGLSMGGHGAFYIALRNQEKFANVGSLSGGLDIRPYTDKWNISARLGSYDQFPERWEDHSVINMTNLLEPGKMNIVFECGTSDFFYQVNCNMHEKLLKEGIPHDFYSRPGGHSWKYWLTNIKYQFIYFVDRFNTHLNK